MSEIFQQGEAVFQKEINDFGITQLCKLPFKCLTQMGSSVDVRCMRFQNMFVWE